MSESRDGFLGRLDQALPELDDIDRIIYRVIGFGFALLTMVIMTGAVWAQYVWQRWWSWDPKETASLVTWLIYAAYLHGRRQRNWPGKTSAGFAVFGFLAVLFTYAGVNFVQSLHSYGLPEMGAHGRVLGGFSGVGGLEVALTTGFFLAYLVSFLSALGGAVWKSPRLEAGGFWVAVLGFLGHTAVLIIRTAEAGRLTFTSGYDFSLWFVWGIILCALIATRVGQRHALLAALPLALVVCMYGYLYFPQKGHEPMPPALQNKLWLHIHVALAIFSYGALALAAGWGLLYWIKGAALRARAGAAEAISRSA